MFFSFFNRTMETFFHMLCHIQVTLDVDHTFLYRIIHDTICKVRPEHAMCMIVDLCQRHLSVLHGICQRSPEELIHGFFVVEPGVRRFDCRVSAAPV